MPQTRANKSRETAVLLTLAVLALALIVAGVALWSVAAALIVGGVIVLSLVFAYERGSDL